MVEILIVAALVLWSAVVIFKKVFPKTSGAFFLKLSNACTEKGWHGLAKWLKPAPRRESRRRGDPRASHPETRQKAV